MTATAASPEALRDKAFYLVTTCRENLKAGNVDTSGIEESIRAYCESIAALPKEDGKLHQQDLNDLMQLIITLGEELVAAQNEVKRELGNLEDRRKANVAYKKSDGMPVKKESGDDGQ